MTVLNLQVGSGANDSAWSTAYFPTTGASDYFGISSYANYQSVDRFTNVTVPQGSTVSDAQFSVKCNSGYTSGGYSGTIHLEAADNPAFPSSAADAAGRTLTTGTNWDFDGASSIFYSGTCTSEVQTVVNRGGFASGNAMQVICKNRDAGPTKRSGRYYYDNSSGDAAKLDITYTAASPTVSSVSANSGPAAGGTNVTITGTGFVATPTVTFGGQAATNVVFVNSTTITCTTPAHAAGAVDVVVTNPDTQTGTGPGAFTYVAPASAAAPLSVGCPKLDQSFRSFTAGQGESF